MNLLELIADKFSWAVLALIALAVLLVAVMSYLMFFHWDEYCRLMLMTSSVTSAPAECILDKAKAIL